MNEKPLVHFSLDTLLDLMIETTSSLLEAKRNNEGNEVIMDKIRMLQSIKKAIVAKRSEHLPGLNLGY